MPEKHRKELVGQNRTEQCCIWLDLSTGTLTKDRLYVKQRTDPVQKRRELEMEGL